MITPEPSDLHRPSRDQPAIAPTGERMCYNVPSSSNPKRTYRVDLIAQGGFGECTCKDWATRRGPAIKAGEPPGTRATMCRHVILARRFFLNSLLAEMAAAESEHYHAQHHRP